MWHFPVEQQSLESISARGMLGYETFQGTWGWVSNGKKKGCPVGRALWGNLPYTSRYLQPADLPSLPSLLRAGAAPVLVPSAGQRGWS